MDLPEHDACCNTDVERMFAAKLRNFDASIATINELLAYAFGFISKNNHHLFFFWPFHLIQQYTAMDLFNCIGPVSCSFECCNGGNGRFVAFPAHRFGSAQRRFVDVSVGRSWCVTAKADVIYPECVCCPEYTAHIVHAPYIFQDNNNGHLS